MLLVILGLIVVGGAAFLIFSQFKPAVGRRLRSGYHGFGFGGFDGFGALQDENYMFKDASEFTTAGSEDGTEGADDGHDDDGKVLYIFGSGEREERSIDEEDGGKDE